jgi:hypothetical protein
MLMIAAYRYASGPAMPEYTGRILLAAGYSVVYDKVK